LAVVQYYLENKVNQTDTCNIFKCSPRTLSRRLNKYNKDGNIKNKQKDSVAYKVKKIHVAFILNDVTLNKTITTNELKNRLHEKFNFVLSRVHIRRIIKDNNITFKNVKLRHELTKRYGKDVNIKDSLNSFYENIKKCKKIR
jgi:transposase